MARRPTTSRSEIEELINKGFTQAEIATIKGISTSGVNWHLKNTGGKPFKTDVERRKEHLPWDNLGVHTRAAQYRRLLDHLEYRETGGAKMSADRLQKLKTFYGRLADFRVIVRYDPDIPAVPGQKFGGFEYAPRTEQDGDMILRADQHTTIPADSRDVWRLPPREDWPE